MINATLKKPLTLYLILASVIFLVIPPGAFVAIASDIVLASALVPPFAVAFMILIATGDIAGDLPRDLASDERISHRRDKMRVQLIEIITSVLRLIIGTIIAKAFCLWFLDLGWFANTVSRLLACGVGILSVLCVNKFTGILPIFNYFIIGADIGSRVRNLRGKADG